MQIVFTKKTQWFPGHILCGFRFPHTVSLKKHKQYIIEALQILKFSWFVEWFLGQFLYGFEFPNTVSFKKKHLAL